MCYLSWSLSSNLFRSVALVGLLMEGIRSSVGVNSGDPVPWSSHPRKSINGGNFVHHPGFSKKDASSNIGISSGILVPPENDVYEK